MSGLLKKYIFFPALLYISCQVSAKFGTCTVVILNGTLVKAKIFTFTFYLQQVSHLDPRRCKCKI